MTLTVSKGKSRFFKLRSGDRLGALIAKATRGDLSRGKLGYIGAAIGFGAINQRRRRCVLLAGSEASAELGGRRSHNGSELAVE